MRRSKGTSTPERPARAAPAAYTFVGGKGGVGKTTCAASMAVRLARRGARTLVISTDPAPSLGDALGQQLGRAPRPVRGVPGLRAVEIDASAALSRLLAGRRAILESIAVRGTWLDEEDAASLLRLSLPGVDEVAALLEIRRHAIALGVEHVVVDTAPTGHLLRMLRMPSLMEALAGVFERMQAAHREVVVALRGRWAPDPADRLLDELDEEARHARRILQDPASTSFVWVTLPERLAVEETLDALGALRRERLRVERVIVNRLATAPPAPCRWCRTRRRLEAAIVAELRAHALVGGLPVHAVPEAFPEPRGVAALDRMADVITRGAAVRRVRTATVAAIHANVPGDPRGAEDRPLAPPGTRLLLFGGKGGVGKSTCAAAQALALARAKPQMRILLLSTDPAHSLADVLGERVSDRATRLRAGPPNLHVRELDAADAFAAVRNRLLDGLHGMLPPGRPAADSIAGDRRALEELLELTPPGIDELAAVLEVLDSLRGEPGRRAGARGGRYDVIVMDTAPTGHALRLLEMPALVHEWVRAFMRILLKYRSFVAAGALGEELVRLSRGLAALKELLQDERRTRFVAITRPAALPRAETARLLDRLAAAGVSVAAIVVNAVGAGTCSRCAAVAREQVREVRALEREAGRRQPVPALLIAGAALPPPRGVASLLDWRARWRSGPDQGRRTRAI